MQIQLLKEKNKGLQKREKMFLSFLLIFALYEKDTLLMKKKRVIFKETKQAKPISFWFFFYVFF